MERAHWTNDIAPTVCPQSLPCLLLLPVDPSSGAHTLGAMPSQPVPTDEGPLDWDRRYSEAGATGVSWYQPEPAMSLALIDHLHVPKGAAVIDVGGGASLLVDRLLARGYTDLAVLDVSSTALEITRRRIGDSRPVRWLHEDITSWQPERRYELWHDRAVFHFLTHPQERANYLMIMRQALSNSGAVIIATFASEGPERCSGLPVARYDATDLERLLDGFTVVESRREEHVTPGGAVQPFTWIAANRDRLRDATGVA
jgi:Methyltransferase domain